jgi:3-oxoacyl-[acyl-carrier protein] reductase
LIPDLAKLDRVLGLYHRTQPRAPAAERVELESVDLRDKAAIAAWVARRRASLGRVTLVHCATASIDGFIAQYAEADWDQVMDVNLKGAFLLTQALLPVMMVERWGRIIHLFFRGRGGRRARRRRVRGEQGGLAGFSRGLAKEYARFNVTSNVLQLGFFEAGLGGRLPEERRARILERIPSRKFGAVADIAAAVEFVMRCDYLTGSTIRIDGAI